MGRYNRPWTEDELEYLNDNYGITPDKVVTRHLNRSINALKIISFRKLSINRKTNIYTARSVADLLGYACSKTVVWWIKKGWIKGERTSIHCGRGLIWHFPYENIEAFVREHPWFFNRNKMEQSFFRSIVDAEFERDPWYNLPQSCKIIGVCYSSSAMASYIKKKWLHPEKKPVEGGNHWTWVFRKSDLDAFMANDPRMHDIPNKVKSRQLKRLRAGKAIEAYMVWKMKCPVCKKRMNIRVNAHIRSDEIKKLFMEKYCLDGTCNHGKKPIFRVARPRLPYKIRKSSGRTKVYPANWPGKKETNGTKRTTGNPGKTLQTV